ncbi:ABC transporter substrate-binding protein [Pseudonocardia sp. TRM90224]|uniref:ABC transporter substrate-binding protein n=1 Tax=Pseudonocardia sp. TRM90224 TaxID=2812678 RepID=UPI001E2CC0E7|nr:ABC transporter substrate-binding protein [Pseudonocardia sp. TRM90224]
MRFPRLLVALAAAGCLTACATPAPAPSPPSGEGFPVTVENCGRQVTFDAPPRRALVLGGEAGSLVRAAGAVERIATFGAIDGEPLGAAQADLGARAQLPVPGSGAVAREVIIAQQPDVVITFGLNETTPEDLAAAGIPALQLAGRCPGDPGPRGLEAMYADIETYGRVFGTRPQATAAVAQLRERVAAAGRRVAGIGAGRGAAALFVGAPDSPLGAYGRLSTAHQQLEALGFRNVFDEVAKRHFEPGTEQVISAAPEVVVALYQASGSTEQTVRSSLAARAELAGVPALAKGSVLPLDYFYAGNGLLAVDGLERLADQLAALP